MNWDFLQKEELLEAEVIDVIKIQLGEVDSLKRTQGIVQEAISTLKESRETLVSKADVIMKEELMWNVDAKEMFQQARANTQPVNTPILQSMDEMLLSIFNEEGHATNLLDENVDFGLRSHDMLYALTNVEKQYGASMITQPEVLNKLEQLFPEGFYVLPSSVHEVLIVPDNGEIEPKMLGEMVREVNKNEVERQEVLSDRVYSYDKEKHQIRQEPDSIQKVKEMER